MTSVVATRYLGALVLLAVGLDHLQQYALDHYSAVPTIGSLFVVNAVAAAVLAAGLAAPVQQLGKGLQKPSQFGLESVALLAQHLHLAGGFGHLLAGRLRQAAPLGPGLATGSLLAIVATTPVLEIAATWR